MKTGKVIGFVVFGVLVTIYAVRFYNLLPDKPHKYKVIPPLVLEDGSVEHTLISYSYNPRKPDLTWVLRFPKELLVDRPEDSYKHTPNTNLSLYFKLPDFSMNVGSAGKTIGDEDGLIVYLTSIITRYGSGFFHYQKRPYDSDSSFSGMRSERFKFNCRAVAEVYPNIFLLRNLSDDEELKQAEMLEEEKRNGRYTSPPMLKCSSGRRSSDEFAVYNADGSIAGAVDCRKKSTSCSGLFWLKQSRVVRYRFEKKHLPNILKIHHEIDAMIDKATVKEKTDDLNIEGETR